MTENWNRKGLVSKIEGETNELIGDRFDSKRVEINIIGSNNKVIIGENAKLVNLSIDIRGNNNIIKIGNDSRIRGYLLHKSNNSTMSIGDRTRFGHTAYLLSQEDKDIIIGNDCMFSYRITLRTTDAHSIIDLESGSRINPAKDIVIGNHVWVGADVLISKGARIADDCIVGARAVVTKDFNQPNCVIAGIPAKVVKTGVTWSHERL